MTGKAGGERWAWGERLRCAAGEGQAAAGRRARGILSEEDRVELLDGEIVEMHAIGSRHFACVNALNQLLVGALSGRAVVSLQGPVHLSRYSIPEPDVAVLWPSADGYARGLPGPEETLLLVEVADNSLRLDRAIRVPLYAAAGIPEVWIVDLTTDAVELHREPHGPDYGLCTRVTEGTVAPVAFPDLEIDVARILPESV